ncbi:hypothetical protein B0A55_00977 [Friedmanniomyces simplex]|uniref:Zinc finger PHD-type domain-containing protein n=1 Tax=Friedmanniomyces simplex TaxID=329884 RepID=A0A4U0Y1B3_9PEZI|nr:hypothetical protein B0A55_00977 [Friedmanniomyces simplex]
MAGEPSTRPKKIRRTITTTLQMRTMSETFAEDSKKIKCKCAGSRPGNGHSLVQCKRCEDWLHVNCMLGDQYTFTSWEAQTGYKCAPSCTDHSPPRSAKGGPPNAPAESAKDTSREVAETDETGMTAGVKTNPKPKRRSTLHSTPPTQADESAFYASLGQRRKSGNLTARGPVPPPKTPSGHSQGSSHDSSLQRDEAQSPSSRANEQGKPERNGQKSPAGLSEERAFYASLGQKLPPATGSTKPPRPGALPTSATTPVAKRKLLEVFRASSRSSADTPLEDARDEIQASRRGHNTSSATAGAIRTPNADGTAYPTHKTTLNNDAAAEDPIMEWMNSTGAPRILCSCEGSPAGNYQGYLICQRCSTLQHKGCIPPAETDNIAKGTLCEPCRDAKVEKLYQHHRDLVQKGQDETKALRDRLESERNIRHGKLKVIVTGRFWKDYCDLPDGKASPAVRELTSTYFDDEKGGMMPIHPAPAAWVEDVLARIHSLVSPANRDMVLQLVGKDQLLMSLSHPARLRQGLSELAVMALHRGLLKGKRQELGVLAEVLGLEVKGTYWQG